MAAIPGSGVPQKTSPAILLETGETVVTGEKAGEKAGEKVGEKAGGKAGETVGAGVEVGAGVGGAVNDVDVGNEVDENGAERRPHSHRQPKQHRSGGGGGGVLENNDRERR